MTNDNSQTVEKVRRLINISLESSQFDPRLYYEYDVNQGLRTAAGRGVRTGLTEVSDVKGYIEDADGAREFAEGTLYYRGYNIIDLVHGQKGKRYGFEEVVYLLLMGELPTKQQMREFLDVLCELQYLPVTFTRDVIMKAQSDNLMNTLEKCILTLYSYDEKPEDISLKNVARQCMNLIAKMPLLTAYSYFSYGYYRRGDNLFLRNPKPELSFSENVLQMLHTDGQFTELEAKMLDLLLIIHAEHGGGTNSTFVNHVTSSSGTDTYSAIAASMGSLKGKKHGGIDLMAEAMIQDIVVHVHDLNDDEELKTYVRRIMDKEAFDGTGNVYGVGHGVYTYSDPRTELIKELLPDLAAEKGKSDWYEFMLRLEKVILEVVPKKRRIQKPVCVTMDFYAGMIYHLLGFSPELYTPLYAMGRVAGWSAHRLEELNNSSKIIRPAYKYIGEHKEYVPMENR